MRNLATSMAVIFFFCTRVSANEVTFLEDFAIATDRAKVLAQLIPGTEDYYYYHCLYHLNRGEFEKVDSFLKPWKERNNNTPRIQEIELRKSILSYDRDPQSALRFLQQKLNLSFHHQRTILGAKPNLPTQLDASLISRNRLLADSLSRWQNLENFEDEALEWLARENLSPSHRRILLQRLKRPDVPGLVSLILEDMNNPTNPTSFGAFPIHQALTLAQLRELQQGKPDLLNNQAFVNAWLIRLQPDADSNWRHDSSLALAYLEKLWDFARALPPSQNSLKAHVLYHRLALERSRNNYDRARFLEYLQLPRQQHYMATRLLNAESSRLYPAQLGADYSQGTLLGPIGTDELLVKSFLSKFFEDMNSPAEFEPFVNDVYLRHLFAQTKIELGQGNVEQWASQLPVDLYKQLRERIDIDFSYTNPPEFKANEPVSLNVYLKNVPSLLVNVYELNATNFFKANGRGVDTDINLDGLVPNYQRTINLDEGPFKRISRKLDFPEMQKPGVYVVDLIGSGKSSRALVHKGKLRAITTVSPSGLVAGVIGDDGKKITDARLLLGEAEYSADKNGDIILPFSNNPGRKPVLLLHQGFASLDHIEIPAETYQLKAAFFVDRESLISQRLTNLLVRASLRLNGKPVSVKTLEDMKLRIQSTDLSGISTVMEVPNFKLFEDREATHEFRVPNRLASIQFTLSAKVKNLSQAKSVDLQASETFNLNQIERTDRLEDMHLARFGNDYVLEVFGRTGEQRAERPVQISLKHREFKNPVQVSLKTDALGRIKLGLLDQISAVTVRGAEGTSHTWTLEGDRHTYRQLIHSRHGEPVQLPHLGTGLKVLPEDYALLELRGNVVVADRLGNVSIMDGMLVIQGLSPGDYDLVIKKTGEKIRIRVILGENADGFILGKTRWMRAENLKTSHIRDLKVSDTEFTIHVKNPTAFTRVHLFANRYQPAFSSYGKLSEVRDAELDGVIPGFNDTVYVVGRNIGDEYRYVLDRKGQKVFAGNMLAKPSLLLNPWAVRSTETGEQLAVGGEAFDKRAKEEMSKPAAPPQAKASAPPIPQDSAFANLDFLADSSAVLTNLVPDENGIIRIPREKLGPHAMIHAVLVDPVSTTSRSVYLAEQPAKIVDLRFANGLDPSKKFSQQKQITILEPNQEFVLRDLGSARMEVYDSLGKVFALYTALSKDPFLGQFGFVTQWKNSKPEEKRKYYSEKACHELSFFIFKKDPEFFKEVVKPFLSNKKDKTFMDLWLLDLPLEGQREGWRYGTLNVAEKTLLSERIEGEKSRLRRYFSDLLDLTPTNTEKTNWFFDSSIILEDLSGGDKFGMLQAQQGLLKEKQAELRKATNLGRGLERDANGMPVPTSGALPGLAGGGMLGGTGALGGIGAAGPGNKKNAASDRAAGDAKGEMKEAGKRDEYRRREGATKAQDGKDLQKNMDEALYFKEREKLLVEQLFRKVDTTMEWAENNYFNLPIQNQNQELVKLNRFWSDYAQHEGKKPFLSKHFPEASGNFTEMMLALSVLDLPFEASKPEIKHDNNTMKLKQGSPVIIFHEEVQNSQALPNPINILISQDFYKQGERYLEVQGEKLDKFITGEFVRQTVYGCQVVVTNPTSSRQKLTVLLQIPVGAIPLAGAQFTKSVALDLEPYRTQTLDYLFYFPAAGKYPHYPALVAKNEKHVTSARPFVFDVVEAPTKVDTTSWEYVSQNGSEDEVLKFLDRENIQSLNLEKIAWRMKDKAFFTKVISLLDSRKVFHPVLWSYSIQHAETSVIDQYLQHNPNLIAECGGGIQSKILNFNPVERHSYEHLEYKPLVNARIHSLGSRRQIVNNRFHEQYHRFLRQLSYKAELTHENLMDLTYYLLLQDRFEEAIASFKKVDVQKIGSKIQHDYFKAYLEMTLENPAEAKRIALGYENYPVVRWANAFREIISQVDESMGQKSKASDQDDRDQKQSQLAASEPALDFVIIGNKLQLNWQNLSNAKVQYYLMDVELLFSRNPFVQQSGKQFSWIVPNHVVEVKLPQMNGKIEVEIPEMLSKKNLLVEIVSKGKAKSLPYYSNAMDVQWMENYGQLKVTGRKDGKPLGKTYVKVYSRDTNGNVKFHKDGYTDLRGRFDYASVSTPEKTALEKFSILVLNEENGAVIREVNVPQQ